MAIENVKKKSISDVMVFDAPEMPDVQMRGLSKWDLFKHLFIGKIGTMVILNLLTLLFALPALADIVIFSMTGSLSNSYVPYSANIGIGYPVVVDAVWRGQASAFYYNMIEFAILIPALALLFLGLGGNMYVMRKLMWGEQTKAAKDFFRGIKKSWWQSILSGLFVGAAIFAFVVSLYVFDVYHLHVAYKVIGIIVASLVLVIVSVYTAFFMAQSTAFRMRFADVIRNSILLGVSSHVVGIFFVAVAVAPILLLLISSMMMLVMIFYVMLGFSFTSLVLTLYCNGRFEKCLYDKANVGAVYVKRDDKAKAENTDKAEKVEKADSESIDKTEKDEKADVGAKPGKAPAVAYKNPKKRKKSNDGIK